MNTIDHPNETANAGITVIPNESAAKFLYEKLGIYSVLFERMLYQFARQLNADYDGGFWNLKVLPNGAFFYDLDDTGTVQVTWSMNYFEGELSVNAFSIAVSIFSLSVVAEEADSDRIIELLHNLKAYATTEHNEAEMLARLFD